jgi:hypothetical protein
LAAASSGWVTNERPSERDPPFGADVLPISTVIWAAQNRVIWRAAFSDAVDDHLRASDRGLRWSRRGADVACR